MIQRTDLALEKRELIREKTAEGVSCEEKNDGKIHITRIKIENEKGEKAIGKPVGNYITLEIPAPNVNPNESKDEIEAVAREIERLVPKKGTVLIAGLGNRNITPDAVGPKTVDATLSTRHISQSMPQFDFRPVAAIAPGVMGQTGVETGEIIKGVCEKIGADCVIAVDALASRSVHRLGRTVQISDTGICPGSGVGNARAELSQKTLGIPVIAVGVPTVVDAATIVSDALSDGGEKYIDVERFENMMVTPREIDNMITAVSRIIALGIGRALQPSLSVSDLYFLSM